MSAEGGRKKKIKKIQLRSHITKFLQMHFWPAGDLRNGCLAPGAAAGRELKHKSLLHNAILHDWAVGSQIC